MVALIDARIFAVEQHTHMHAYAFTNTNTHVCIFVNLRVGIHFFNSFSGIVL